MENTTHRNDSDHNRFQAVGQAVEGLKDSIGNATHQTGDAAYKVMNEVSESGKKVMRECAEEGKKGMEYIEHIARERPITTILVSAAAGLLLAKLIRR